MLRAANFSRQQKSSEQLAGRRNREKRNFVDGEIALGIADGSFTAIPEADALIVNPISVAENKTQTKLRMCLDARWHNAHCAHVRFSLGAIESMMPDIVREGDDMISADITRAYYSVPITEEARAYLAFRHRGKLFAPTVLPFGSALAPFVFTRITRVVLRFNAVLGLRATNFFDDFLWAFRPEEGPSTVELAKWLIAGTGWRTNEKCEWTPAKRIRFLGFIVDSACMTLTVTPERLARAKEALRLLLRSPKVRRKEVESLVGQLASMRPAIHAATLWLRATYADVHAHEGEEVWDLCEDATSELMFWRKNLLTRPVGPIVALCATESWWLDGAEAAIGAHSRTRELSVPLPANLPGSSSTRRELFALEVALQNWAHLAPRRTIRVFFDSFAATRNLCNGGGPVWELSLACRRIWAICQEHSITLAPTWIPREQNWRADALSKRYEAVFLLSDEARASAELIAREWQGQGLVPDVANVPFNEIRPTLHTLREDKSSAFLIVPEWCGQPWWALLQQGKRKYQCIGSAEELLLRPPEALHLPIPRWRIALVWIDFA